MNLFVKQLKALKTTMSTVGPEQFDMGRWHCNTVVCICGHQAVSGDLTYFPASRLESTNLELVYRKAYKIVEDLDNACKTIFGSDHLSRSVWQPCARKWAAKHSLCLTQEQLNHPHLTTDSSPADVVDYIDMLLGVIK